LGVLGYNNISGMFFCLYSRKFLVQFTPVSPIVCKMTKVVKNVDMETYDFNALCRPNIGGKRAL
jgi:hypothetical protein